jgi:4-hydroxy-tetrahydrodipicolinate reductase
VDNFKIIRIKKLYGVIMSIIKVGVSGAAGRMGRRLVSLISADQDVEVAGAIESPLSKSVGCDVGELAGIGQNGVIISGQIDKKLDVLIDFSSPSATDAIVSGCVKFGIPLVFATTGITDEQNAMLLEASKRIPILTSPSMSLMVNLAMNLCKIAAKTLADKDADVEIVETHHRYKVDAPSGTALKFGRIIADEMGINKQQHGRNGQIGERPRNEIGYHAVRLGDNPGEHSILFGILGESLTISAKATNRDCYAIGAITAAKFLHNKPPQMYNMNDVLF